MFDQQTLTCNHPEDAFPCEESPSLFGAVEFGKIPDSDYWSPHTSQSLQTEQNTLKHKQIYREKTSCHTPDIINTQYYSQKKEGSYWPWWRPGVGWWWKRRMNDDLNDLISLSSLSCCDTYIQFCYFVVFCFDKNKTPRPRNIFYISNYHHRVFVSLNSSIEVSR